MIGLELMAACAPNVAPETIERIVHVESRGNPLALNVNKRTVTVKLEDGTEEKRGVTFKLPFEVKTKQDAVTVAYMAIEAGHSVDMGYMQVNSKNLPALGYTVEEMYDECKNLTAGGRVLTAFYASALPRYPNEQAALWAALSAYNTGDFDKGRLNGYLALYGATPQPGVARVPAVNPYTADTAVLVRQPSRKETAMSSTKEESAAATQQAEQTDAQARRVDPIVSESPKDGDTPGVQVEHTAEQAEANGAFEETAMSEADAWESNADMDDPEGTAIRVPARKGGR